MSHALLVEVENACGVPPTSDARSADNDRMLQVSTGFRTPFGRPGVGRITKLEAENFRVPAAQGERGRLQIMEGAGADKSKERERPPQGRMYTVVPILTITNSSFMSKLYRATQPLVQSS